MTQEAQRIAIATHCGWTRIGTTGNHGIPYGIHPDNRKRIATHLDDIPDYANSLDALHEAEKTLTEHQRFLYRNALVAPTKYTLDDEWDRMHATAPQRAEAFLRTLNLWDDSK